MPLETGTKLGPYEVAGAVGARVEHTEVSPMSVILNWPADLRK